MSDVESTWATRDLPILVAVFRRIDAGEYVDPKDVWQETGLTPRELRVGLQALEEAQPPYIAIEWASGWSDERVGGAIVTSVSERARRELGAWPSPENLVEQLVMALERAAEDEPEPERKGRLHNTALVLGGIARDIAVGATAAQLGRL